MRLTTASREPSLFGTTRITGHTGDLTVLLEDWNSPAMSDTLDDVKMDRTALDAAIGQRRQDGTDSTHPGVQER